MLAAQTPPSTSRQNELRLDPNGKFTSFGHYMHAKVNKLIHQVHDNVTYKSRIFDGISIYVNGYTDPPALELRKLIVENGGEYHHYYFYGQTTYMVANGLSVSKWNTLRANEKVIRPSWLTESVRTGKLLPENKFLLRKPNSPAEMQANTTVNFQPQNFAHHNSKNKSSTNNIGLQMTRPVLFCGGSDANSKRPEGEVGQPSITKFLHVRKTPSPNVCEEKSTTKNDDLARNLLPAKPPKPASKYSTTRKLAPKKNTAMPRRRVRVERRILHTLTEAPNFSKDLISANVEFRDGLLLVGSVEIAYREEASKAIVENLLTLFTRLVEESHFFKVKSFFSFLQRNLFSLQDAHPDWLIVVTELKTNINRISLQLYDSVIFY